MWFTDDGATPAVGRITPRGRIREFSAGLLAGSDPAFITAGPDGRMWFSDEGSTAALGTVITGVPMALAAARGPAAR
jgi:streptogramin lyase